MTETSEPENQDIDLEYQGELLQNEYDQVMKVNDSLIRRIVRLQNAFTDCKKMQPDHSGPHKKVNGVEYISSTDYPDDLVIYDYILPIIQPSFIPPIFGDD